MPGHTPKEKAKKKGRTKTRSPKSTQIVRTRKRKTKK